MSDPIATILRFNGDPDDLLGRFEQAWTSWTDAQDDDHNPPAFFAICTAEEGIVVVAGWKAKQDQRAFRKGIIRQLQAVGMGVPDGHEHLRIARLGEDPAPAAP